MQIVRRQALAPELGGDTRSPRALLRRLWDMNRPLAAVGLAMMVLLAVTLAGLALDRRVITGAPAWLKPAKFALSLGIYSFSFVWLLSYVQGWPRLVRLVARVTAVGALVEMVIIAAQAVRGTSSHFNTGTPFDGVLFSIMGFFVLALWVSNLLAAVLLLRQRLPDRALAWSLRLGLLIALLGGALGGLMLRPSPAQLDALERGGPPARVGVHSVGVPDGGAGLPLVGWSTEGGDLRVPHFVGLHALQLLPLAGWLTTRRRVRERGERARVALVATAGLSYLGLVALLLWQALRGQPLVAPDGATLAALAALVAATVAAVALIMRGQGLGARG